MKEAHLDGVGELRGAPEAGGHVGGQAGPGDALLVAPVAGPQQPHDALHEVAGVQQAQAVHVAAEGAEGGIRLSRTHLPVQPAQRRHDHPVHVLHRGQSTQWHPSQPVGRAPGY